MKFLKFFLIVIILFPLSSVNAEENDKRNKITKNLRCLICQGQSVYDSDSEFANSLKIVLIKKFKKVFLKIKFMNILKLNMENGYFTILV